MDFRSRFPTVLLTAILMMSASLGCSSSTPTPDAPPTEQTPKSVHLEPAADIFARYAPYMPADTAFVAIVQTAVATAFLEDIFYSEDGKTGPAHLGAMRADFGELLLANIGIDPLSANAVVVAAGPSGRLAIVDGAVKTAFTDLETVESNGLHAYIVHTPVNTPIWVTPLPDDAGVALFEDAMTFEAFASLSADPSTGLPHSPAFEVFRGLLSNQEAPFISGAIVFDATQKQDIAPALPFPAPDAFSIHLGDDLRVELRGEEAGLKETQKFIDGMNKQVLDMLTQQYQNRQNMALVDEARAIWTYHLLLHLNDNLKVTPSADRLTYTLTLPRRLATFSGLLASFAIPAFLKYIARSKTAEAHSILNQLRQSAESYYQNGHADGTCSFPASANPLPPGEPCCDGVGPSNGKKWSTTPETWAQEGWSALNFAPNDPTYFAYQMINKSNPGDIDILELRAFADFKPGGPRHTLIMTLIGQKNDQGICETTASPTAIQNELE